MRQYLELVCQVLREGNYKPNRTGVDSISSFDQHYSIDLAKGFPLLTTKKMDGFRWKSLIYEFLWFLSGEEHIRNLREKTGIWDAWADEEGHLDTSYGRFWRRFPFPEEGVEGEVWPDRDCSWVNEEGTFDQIQYVIDQLQQKPQSRRIVVTAWHPANAAVSSLPACPYTFVFNVQGEKLNLHLTQRSGDIALGIPFNIASYSLLVYAFAQGAGFEAGQFSHTIVDAHIYCGSGERGDWYRRNLDRLQARLSDVTEKKGYLQVKSWVEEDAPSEENQDYDHVPGLLLQLSRTPRERPTIKITNKPLDELKFKDIELHHYNAAEGINFEIAE